MQRRNSQILHKPSANGVDNLRLVSLKPSLRPSRAAADPVIEDVLSRIPSSTFLLTVAHEHSRFGMLARWVQPCAKQPPMVMAAVERGNAVAPLMRDSRRFALCEIAADDRATIRRFSMHHDPDADPFIGLDILPREAGPPILSAAASYLDCELARHVDIGGDHEIYVGLVQDAAVLRELPPRSAA
jgi:flavin reductase (DIM6/NTAB) family NADH-FMN oxidoreductase RutF